MSGAVDPGADMGRSEDVAAPVRERRRSPLLRLWLPLAWVLLVFGVALVADWLPIPPPNHMDFAAVEQGPSNAHLLGTDLDGRDLLSRLA
ncbi:MAG: hypothetical protein IH616_24550, partial [Gemmatimonadales bacterium]|nr:hypothetical protein [Gemmatimonadales bacterium]